MQTLVPVINSVEYHSYFSNYHPLTIHTERGPLEARFYKGNDLKRACIYLGGIGGGFDTPAKGLYLNLAEDLLEQGISSLRLKYRFPTLLQEAVYDAQVGIKFLASLGLTQVGVVGHSFGGAVAIGLGAFCSEVQAVVALSSQSSGACEFLIEMAAKPILFIHGLRDNILSAKNSRLLFELAKEPKRLEIIEAGHLLDEAADDVYELTSSWLKQNLKA